MSRLLSAYEGSSFLVIEDDGDIVEGNESGLYRDDTRKQVFWSTSKNVNVAAADECK